MRRAAKTDRNQSEIVNMLRLVGCTVQPLHMVGRGCPDILVGRQGVNYALELKDGSLPPSARKLTPAEAKWHAEWRGQVVTVCSVREALEAVGISSSGWVA